MKTMQEMHEKMMQAKTPEERSALGRAGNMATRQAMLEKRMDMMQSMMQMMTDQMQQLAQMAASQCSQVARQSTRGSIRARAARLPGAPLGRGPK